MKGKIIWLRNLAGELWIFKGPIRVQNQKVKKLKSKCFYGMKISNAVFCLTVICRGRNY